MQYTTGSSASALTSGIFEEKSIPNRPAGEPFANHTNVRFPDWRPAAIVRRGRLANVTGKTTCSAVQRLSFVLFSQQESLHLRPLRYNVISSQNAHLYQHK